MSAGSSLTTSSRCDGLTFSVKSPTRSRNNESASLVPAKPVPQHARHFFNDLSLVTILSGCEINNFAGQSAKSVCYNLVAMFDLFRLWLGHHRYAVAA